MVFLELFSVVDKLFKEEHLVSLSVSQCVYVGVCMSYSCLCASVGVCTPMPAHKGVKTSTWSGRAGSQMRPDEKEEKKKRKCCSPDSPQTGFWQQNITKEQMKNTCYFPDLHLATAGKSS